MSEDDESKKRKKRNRKAAELEKIHELLELIYRKLTQIERGGSSELFMGGSARAGSRSGMHYQGTHSYSKPEPKQNPKSESSSYGKISKEPEVHVSKERVVYDPELRNMLENIRKRLDEFQPQSEGEACEQEKGKIAETLDKIEKEFLSQEEEKESAESVQPEPETKEQKDEPKAEEIQEKQAPEQDEVVAEETVEPLPIIEEKDIEDVKALNEELEAVEPKDEYGIEGKEIEPEETRIELSEPESELSNLEPVLPEDLDDPVFWQNVENEIIEKRFKRPELRPEPEVDEYGY